MALSRTLSFFVVALGLAGSFAACSSSTTPAGSSDDAGTTTDTQSPDPTPLAVKCDDGTEAIYAAPGDLPAEKGAIVKCSRDRSFTKAELEALARANTYAYDGKPFVSGARVYRVTYATERGTVPATVGYTSALVLVPDAPVAGAPAIVAAHGTAGQAPGCTPSKVYALDSKANPYFSMAYPLVGAGYPVIVPDYAGYANYGAANNPPSGYAAADDVGKSVLDGVRALRKLVPTLASADKAIVVGHSQGGHSALSALAISESYGVPLTGVATYAPLWFNQATWGALLYVANDYPLATNEFPAAVGVWYHYSHAELLDGPGHGVDPFAADKRAAIKDFFDKSCEPGGKLSALGTTAKDLYDPAFTQAVALPSALGAGCGDTDELCKKWKARYAASRPKLTGKAAKTPLLVLYGDKDTTIPPDRAMCAFDRLKSDGAAYQVCLTREQTHSGIVGARAGYVNDWIANVALGQAAPAPCAESETALKTDKGEAVTCANPPPND